MILQNSEAVISIDMPAGPSEVLVIADKHANSVHIAADLLSQAEHGPDSQVVLVVVGDGADINAIDEQITKQCQSLPRGEIASKAMSHSFTVFAHDMIEERGNGSCTCTQTTRCAKDRVENPQAIAKFLMSFFPEKAMLLVWDVLSELVESMRTPYLFLCSEDDDLAPVQTICNFAQRIQELGADVTLVKWASCLAHLI